MSRIYVYALLSAAPPCESDVGVCAERLRVVTAGDICALVGDVAEAPPATAATLRAQDAVLRRVAGAIESILPTRFGTVVDDEAALTDALTRRSPELARALGRVAGCEQMTLRVWGEATAAPAAAPVVEGLPGTRYLMNRRQALERARQVPELEPLRRRLGELVREELAERHDRPPLLATVQHLVPRAAGGRYVEAVDGAREALRPYRVSVTGPWLPYAFGKDPA